MAAPQVPLKDALKVIPVFDGTKGTLSIFLEGCDEAREMAGAAQEGLLVRLIRGKLIVEARKTIQGMTFDTLNALKAHLRTIYLSTKTIHQLQRDMSREFQRDDQSVISFANRIRELKNHITEIQEANTGAPVAEGFRNELTATAIDCRKRGLKPEIVQGMREVEGLQNSLNEALNSEKGIEARIALRSSPFADPNKNQKRGVAYAYSSDPPKAEIELAKIQNGQASFKHQNKPCTVCNCILS